MLVGYIGPSIVESIDQSSPVYGEKRLWANVLLDAIAKAHSYSHFGRSRDFDYIFKSRELKKKRIGSYFWICEALEIDPIKLRAKLKRYWPQLDFRHARIGDIEDVKGDPYYQRNERRAA